MKCPECSQPVLIKTTVMIKHHPDESWDVETPFEFNFDDPVECTACDWAGTYQALNRSTGAARGSRSRARGQGILKHATPYPWGRDGCGNLIGANGRAIYFMGADSVLVEYAPVMLEHLLSVRKQAALTGSQDPGDGLHAIWRLSDNMISEIDRTYASSKAHVVRRVTARNICTTKLPSSATRTPKR